MTVERYVVREGKVRGEGRYLTPSRALSDQRRYAMIFTERKRAEANARGNGDRVVRLVLRMHFEQALRAMRAGMSVRRPAWREGLAVYIAAEGPTWVFYEKPDDRRCDSMFVSDILAGDWQVVE